VIDYLAVACLASAIALLLDELWDGRTHPEHGLRWRDLLNPRSHEFVIAVLIVIAVLAWLALLVEELQIILSIALILSIAFLIKFGPLLHEIRKHAKARGSRRCAFRQGADCRFASPSRLDPAKHMKLRCCDWDKEYEGEVHPAKNFMPIASMTDIGRNLFSIIRCPHCGLEHFMLVIKLRR